MAESNEMLALRGMAWERAKGELMVYLHTFWQEYTAKGVPIDNGFDKANDLIKSFIKDFEDECR